MKPRHVISCECNTNGYVINWNFRKNLYELDTLTKLYNKTCMYVKYLKDICI